MSTWMRLLIGSYVRKSMVIPWKPPNAKPNPAGGFHAGRQTWLDLTDALFDANRSVSWVSRRLALAELLPESIQQQVREGQIGAQVALKFLVPVARQSLQD